MERDHVNTWMDIVFQNFWLATASRKTHFCRNTSLLLVAKKTKKHSSICTILSFTVVLSVASLHAVSKILLALISYSGHFSHLTWNVLQVSFLWILLTIQKNQTELCTLFFPQLNPVSHNSKQTSHSTSESGLPKDFQKCTFSLKWVSVTNIPFTQVLFLQILRPSVMNVLLDGDSLRLKRNITVPGEIISLIMPYLSFYFSCCGLSAYAPFQEWDIHCGVFSISISGSHGFHWHICLL